MFKPVSPREERLLRELLRREAMESRPAFSESLHRRIVGALSRRRASAAAAPLRPPVSRHWWRRAAAALAAACLLSAALLGHRLLDGTSRQQVVVPSEPPVSRASLADVPSIHDVADRAVAGLDQYTVSVGLEPQATHLKHTRQPSPASSSTACRPA